MIIFLLVTISLMLTLLPIVKEHHKGMVEFFWVKGFVIGANYDSIFFGAEIDGKEKAFKLHNFQFHIIFMTITMSFSVERPDVEIEKE